MLSVPLVGEWMNNLLLAVSANGVKRVYANHLAGLMVIGTYLCVAASSPLLYPLAGPSAADHA